MHGEQWLPAKGHKGLYEVSDLGRVRSIPRTYTRFSYGKRSRVTIKGKLLAQYRHPHGGHMSVQLPRMTRNGQKNCRVKVSVLMLETFIGPRPKGMVARHLNDISDDDRLINLRWGTQSENRHDSVRNLTHGYARRTHCKHNHEYTPENTLIIAGRSGRSCLECKRRYSRENARRARLKRRNSADI